MLRVSIRHGTELALCDAATGAPRLGVGLLRTLRVPDDDRTYPLPPGMGPVPLCDAADYPVPSHWLAPPPWAAHASHAVTLIAPMYRREAVWLLFSTDHPLPHAVKIGCGGIDAISGQPLSPALTASPARAGAGRGGEVCQDYAVCPPQQFIDGFNTGRGSVRQLVAMPLGEGVTVEAQLTGRETIGGVQLLVYPPRQGRIPGLLDTARPQIPGVAAVTTGALDPPPGTTSDDRLAWEWEGPSVPDPPQHGAPSPDTAWPDPTLPEPSQPSQLSESRTADHPAFDTTMRDPRASDSPAPPLADTLSDDMFTTLKGHVPADQASTPTSRPVMPEPVPASPGMLVCARCSKENQEHYKFCLGCGAELAGPAPSAPGDVGMMKSMMADVGPPRGPSGPSAPGGAPVVAPRVAFSAPLSAPPPAPSPAPQPTMARAAIADAPPVAVRTMGLAAGGHISQKIYPDPFGIDTWDQRAPACIVIHLVSPRTWRAITGEPPPPTPVTLAAYQAAGYPWFSLYDDDLGDIAPSDRLRGVRSIEDIDRDRER